MYWLNVDFPTRLVKVHCESCRWCKPRETMWKGVGEMKRDGGWVSFETLKTAEAEYKKNFNKMIWEPCKICGS